MPCLLSARRRLSLLAVALALGAPAARAVTLNCTGSVDEVQLSNLGAVFIKPAWRGDFVQICSSAATWKTITTATCKNWTAAAMLAYTTGAPLLVGYLNTSAADCSAMLTYGSADAPSQLTNQ
jgi:hypothetical protein